MVNYMGQLNGRVALVTGANGGVGISVVQKFLKEGAQVVALDLQDHALEPLNSERARYRRLDVTNEQDWHSAVDFSLTEFGRVDILVNCAAYLKPGVNLETTTLENWRETFRVNAEGTFLACRHAIGAMKKSGGGSIVTIASGVAVRASTKAPAYGASKAAVIALTKSVALHCANEGYNIRANVILPGALDTPMLRRNVQHSGLSTEDYLERIRKTHPIGRLGTADDIANMALFLASDASSFMTGAEVFVDGGQSI